MPAVYGLKGSALSIPTMRKCMHDVRKECKEGVKVLRECYDGQWAMMIMTQKDILLSCLQVMKKIWLKDKKATKLAMLQFLDAECCISKESVGCIKTQMRHVRMKDLTFTMKDKQVWIESNRRMKKVQTPGNKVIWEFFIQKTKPKAVVTNEGPQTSDVSRLQAAFTCSSTDNPISVYSRILTALCILPSGHKWEMVTPQVLKCWVLNNANSINKLLVGELNSIHNVMKEFSGVHLFTTAKVKKLHKVNILNKAFGDGVDMKETPPIQRRKVPTVKKGMFLDFKHYAEDFFLTHVIQRKQ